MKSLLLAVIGTLAAGSSLTVAYTMDAFDGLFGSAEEKLPGNITSLTSASGPWDATLPGLFSDFRSPPHPATKERVNLGDCVKRYFPGFDASEHATYGDGILFFDSESDSGTAAKSCLSVNWEREDYSDGYWKGNFRWMWSFVNGNKGFVWFSVISTSTTEENEEKKMELKGECIALEKNASGDWKINRIYPAWGELTESNFDNAFPKAPEPMKSKFETQDKQEGWGFVKKDEMERLCKSDVDGECTTLSKKEGFKGLLTWEGSSSDLTGSSLTSWSSNFENWDSKLNMQWLSDLTSGLSIFKGKWNEPYVFEKFPMESVDIPKE